MIAYIQNTAVRRALTLVVTPFAFPLALVIAAGIGAVEEARRWPGSIHAAWSGYYAKNYPLRSKRFAFLSRRSSPA